MRRPRGRQAATLAALALLAAALPRAAAQTEVNCLYEIQAAADAGNCTTSDCPDVCLEALTQIPFTCAWNGNDSVSDLDGSNLDLLRGIMQACGVQKLLSVNSTEGSTHYDSSASTALIVKYLLGICIGSVLMSVVFIVLMAAPMLLSQAIGAPTMLIAQGRRAARHGKAAYQTGKEKLAASSWGAAAQGGWNATVDALSGSSSKQLAATAAPPGAPPAKEPSAAKGTVHRAADRAVGAAKIAAGKAVAGTKQAAVEVGEAAADSLAALQHGVVDVPAPAAGSDKGSGVADEETGGGSNRDLTLVQTATSGGARTGFVVWAVLAAGLYCAALALLIVGTLQFVNNSVASYSLSRSNRDGALIAIQWLIIGGLILTGVCDLVAIYIVLAANREGFMVRKWRLRNYLYSRWVNRHAYKIHVVVAGLVTLVLSVACILFGLGIIVVILQLATQLFCAELDSLSINGTTISDVCINVPTSDAPLCGWGALDVCYDITSMGVLSIVLGSALLLWSHIVWLTLLLLSMWRFLSWKVQYAASTPAGSSAQLQPLSDEPGTNGNQLIGTESSQAPIQLQDSSSFGLSQSGMVHRASPKLASDEEV